MNDIDVSIVIPIFNEEKTIERLVSRLIELLSDKRLQIILVNDGSTDQSDDKCKTLIQAHPLIITYLLLSRNFGEHNAVMAGLNYAKGKYAVIMDADFQNPPQEVLRLLNTAMEGNFDIVYSYYEQKEHHFIRSLGSKTCTWVENFLIEKPRDLYLCSFKILTESVVREIIKDKRPFPYIDALALKYTKNFGKIMCQHNKRLEGSSAYNLKRLFDLWITMLVNFSVNPLRVFALIAYIWCFFALIIGGGMLAQDSSVISLPMSRLILGFSITFFVALQLFILIIIGAYIRRLAAARNQVHQFVIKEIYQR